MARRISKWTPEKITEIRKMLAEGLSYKDIAKAFGTTPTNIGYTIWKYKIVSETKSSIKKQLTAEDLASRIAWLKGESIKPDIPSITFSDEEIKAWLNGVNGFELFCKQVLNIELLPFQLEITENAIKNKRLAVLGGRGVGKDFWASCYSLYQAITNSNFKCLIISSAQRQSDLLGDRIFSHIGKNDKLIASVLKPNREQISFRNNSVIYLLPSTSFVRGFQNINLVIVNEASFIPNSREFVESVVMPMLGTVSGSLILLSTPLASSNDDIMWTAYNNKIFKTLRYPSSMNTKSITPEYLTEQKLLTTHQNYMREYEAEFIDVQNCFFDSKIIDRCCKDYDFVSEADPNKKYYIGYDPARIRDSSVIVVISEDENKILRIEFIKEFFNTPFSEQELFMFYLNQRFKPVKIVVEYAGLGIAPADSLEEKGLHIVRFNPAKEKLEAYELFKSKMEKNEIIIPLNYPKLITELKFFQYKVLSSGNVSLYHESSGSDDVADATCFAVWGTAQKGWGIAVLDIQKIDPQNLMGLW